MKHIFTLSLCFFALSLSVYGQTPDYIPTDGLIGWMPFEGLINNQVSPSSEVEVSGNIVYSDDRYGTPNSSINLYDVQWIKYSDIEFNSALEFSTSTWVNLTDLDEDCSYLFHLGYDAGSSGGYCDGTGVSIAGGSCVNPNILSSHFACLGYYPTTYVIENSINTWIHIAYNVSTIAGYTEIFVNGQSLGQQTLPSDENWSYPSNHIFLGSYGPQSSYNDFYGLIDDFGIWNRLLTNEEVLGLYLSSPPIIGCTDSIACNYNEQATSDDESCEYYTCKCLDGTVWSDELEGCIVENPTDSNLDGCTDLNDLMNLLGAYGICAVSEFTCGDPLEYQGYDYETVQIGEQCWFAENSRYLPSVSPSSASSTTNPYYYVYGYEGTDVTAAQATDNYETYGVLYNWPAVMTDEFCPSNWRVPSDDEFTQLSEFLGGSSLAGGKMKSTYGWNDNGNGSNLSGLTGLPGGYVDSGGFYDNGSNGYWWSSSEIGSNSWVRRLDFNSVYVDRNNYGQGYGFSARCVRD